MCIRDRANSWAHPDENSSVYELKAYVENVFARLGLHMHDLVVGNLTDDIYACLLYTSQMKDLKDQVSSMESKHADLENRLSEEHKLRDVYKRQLYCIRRQEHVIGRIS